jgi:hypothetical protein
MIDLITFMVVVVITAALSMWAWAKNLGIVHVLSLLANLWLVSNAFAGGGISFTAVNASGSTLWSIGLSSDVLVILPVLIMILNTAGILKAVRSAWSAM